MDTLLSALRAAAEPTRLRLLALCAESEMTVSELTRILGQSQPRVSRHLKLLCDAGLVERVPEGSWVFYRLADDRPGDGQLAQHMVRLIPAGDGQLRRDRAKLDQIKRARSRAAAEYFRRNAAGWDRIRSLHVDEAEVEAALLAAVPGTVSDLLDIGTGTGRILRLFAGRIRRGTGIDLSPDMLAVARADLEAAGARNCRVRKGDMYGLPVADDVFDAVTIHQVLHYAARPAAVIAEAARVLRPGGRLVIADFAPHTREELRNEAQHRRLGFADAEVAAWCRAAGLRPGRSVRLAGDPLTVVIWRADRPQTAAPAETRSGPQSGPRSDRSRETAAAAS
jgi:ArsR family transcriptional regulator